MIRSPRATLLQSHESREFRPRSAHPIAVHYCAVDLSLAEDGVEIRSTVRTADRTGIEMEALTAVTVAALTIIDMVKGIDKLVAIRECYVEEKSGGRSGTWTRSAR